MCQPHPVLRGSGNWSSDLLVLGKEQAEQAGGLNNRVPKFPPAQNGLRDS